MEWSFHPHRLPLSRPYRWARGVQEHRDVLLVRLQLDITGWGEVALPPDEPMDADALVAQAKQMLEGNENPEAIEGPSRLRCGITTAWMDAQARQDDQTLAQWLGRRTGRAARDSVAINALLTSKDAMQLRQEAAEAVAAGHRAIKLKVGSGDDLARAEAVRKGAPDVELRLDANGAWGDDALDRMEQVAHLDIAYVEQPVPPHQEDLLAQLSRDGPFPVALDESATDPQRLGALLAAGIGSVAILKPQRLGGLDRTVAAMEVAKRHGARAIVTNSLESSIGLHAALHVSSLLGDDEACGLGTSSFIATDVAPVGPIVDGRMRVPGPGLGVHP